MAHEKTYLGDAVYAAEDAYGGVVLTTSDGMRDTNTIVLEPEVTNALLAWLLTPLQLAAVIAVNTEAEASK